MTETFNRQIGVLLYSGGDFIDLTKSGQRLNIGFTVERTQDGEPSTAAITIHNLSKETQEKLKDTKGWTVELAAGYGDKPHPFFLGDDGFEQNSNVIFKGDVRLVRHRREPPLLATDIEADDGGEASKKVVNRHFAKNTTIGTVFKWLQEQSGLGAGNVARISSIGNADGLPDRLENGITLRGFAMDELSDLARSREVRLSSQNNELIVLEKGEPLEGAPVTKISPATGLIGYPYVDNEGILTLNHRMLPNVAPGYPIDVESDFVNGRFVVERAVYSGSLYGDDFNTEIEAVEIKERPS